MAWEPAWKKLVEQLQDREHESPYLDRLRERLDTYQEREGLEKEILQEMAHSLARTEDKVNVALLQCELAAREVDAAADAERRAAWIDEFNRRREHALAMRRELQIHREALGFHRHRALEELYPIPPKRRRPDELD